MRIVKTKTADGYHFNGLLSEAENSKKIIIHIHGMAGSVVYDEFYVAMHQGYQQNGYSFLVGEHRGTGIITPFAHESSDGICGNAFEIFEDCVYDIQAWIDFAKNEGYEEIWLQAHSLGPSKIAYYVSQTENHGIKGLIWISPTDMVGLIHIPAGEKEHDILFPEAQKLVAEGKGTALLSQKLWGDNILSADSYLSFFGENAKDAIFNYGDDNLGWGVINAINIPILAITSTNDVGIVPVMDATKAMEKLKAELKNSPRVETKVYEEAQHSFDGFGDRIVKDVIAFIKGE